MFEKSLARHQAFWERRNKNRPLFGLNVGYYAHKWYPRLMPTIKSGPLDPRQIRTDLFLKDVEDLFQLHEEAGGDYPFTAGPLIHIPWLEAILGCPVRASETTFWSEPFVNDWADWHWRGSALKNPWAEKLLELMRGLAELAKGRFPVTHTLMRGPADLIAALRGADLFPMDVMLNSEVLRRVAEEIADVWVEVGQAQLDLLPPSAEGYMAGGNGLRVWGPDKTIWLQEDSMALLSPELYRAFLCPIDERLTAAFPCTAFHLHGSAQWAVDELVKLPDLGAIQFNVDIGEPKKERFFPRLRQVLERKPLVIGIIYEADFWSWLDRLLAEFPPEGLAILVTGEDLNEVKMIRDGFFERVGQA